jgi:membrane protein YqaA with SNARE-associated domain
VTEPTSPPAGATAAAAPRPNWLRRLYAWVLHWALTRYGTPALALLSFAESSFFPVPPDVLQVALSVSRPRRSFFYAAVSTAASVLGGIVGWLIGALLWSAVGHWIVDVVPGVSSQTFAYVQGLYRDNAFVAILTAAFTPIPYKVFTLASGVFGVPLATLVIASLLGRGGRFFAVGGLIFAFGPAVTRFLDRYFELVSVVALVLVIAGFWAIQHWMG